MPLRLLPATSARLRAESKRTGRSQTALLNAAVDRVYGDAAALDAAATDRLVPPVDPYQRVPAKYRVKDGVHLERILAQQRQSAR